MKVFSGVERSFRRGDRTRWTCVPAMCFLFYVALCCSGCQKGSPHGSFCMNWMSMVLESYVSEYGRFPHSEQGQAHALYVLASKHQRAAWLGSRMQRDIVAFHFDDENERVTDLAIDYLNPPPDHAFDANDPEVLLVRRFTAKGARKFGDGDSRRLLFLSSDHVLYEVLIPDATELAAASFLGKRVSDILEAYGPPAYKHVLPTFERWEDPEYIKEHNIKVYPGSR